VAHWTRCRWMPRHTQRRFRPIPRASAFDARRQRLYWSSDGAFEPARTGEPAIMSNPWVRIAGLDGSLGEFTMPPGSNMSAAGDVGPRPNQSLEGLTLSPAETI
jgi:hypothetical protein